MMWGISQEEDTRLGQSDETTVDTMEAATSAKVPKTEMCVFEHVHVSATCSHLE